MNQSTEKSTDLLDTPILQKISRNKLLMIFLVIVFVGVVSRLYDLGERVMSHDEINHVVYSWQLSEGLGYNHQPLSHGPLQFHLQALSFFLFGDNDFTARLTSAVCSILTIAFMWQYRRYLGNAGAIVAGAMFTISPYLLYYGRYARNEALVGLFSVVVLWAALRYLDTGKSKYLLWLTGATALHFASKETAFIFTAQLMIFLGLLMIYRVMKRKWNNPDLRTPFTILLLAALAFLLLADGVPMLQDMTAPEAVDAAAFEHAEEVTQVEESKSLMDYLPLVFLGLTGLMVLFALIVLIRGLSWQRLKNERAFEMILLLLTLVLPQLAPFPMEALGLDSMNYYDTDGVLLISAFVVPLIVISIAAGLIWKPKIWAQNAILFYAIFIVFYTSMFSNVQGFFTGLVGSLGYWLEQQAVERGSQPLYYYWLIQIPLYEYLPALGSLFAFGFGLNEAITRFFNRGSKDETLPERTADEIDYEINNPTPAYSKKIALILIGYWVITSLLAYTIAGERMPWLTVHIALPMILLGAWWIGWLIEKIDWSRFREKNGWLAAILLPVLGFSFLGLFKSLVGGIPPFQGKTTEELTATSEFILYFLTTAGTLAGLVYLLRSWKSQQITRFLTLSVFAFFGILTARHAIMASYINYDKPTEYLVYAHAARGPKDILEQVEEISLRTTNDLDIQVAYDNDSLYPFWWYFRNYPNANHYGGNPTRSLQEYPVILVGQANYPKIEPVVREGYYRYDYVRMVWPNMDYFDLTWDRVVNAVTDPEIREGIFQIWFNRDYTAYGEALEKDMSMQNWYPSDKMRLYVRKDVASQMWDYGVSAAPEELFVDPYQDGDIILEADTAFSLFDGIIPPEVNSPRDIAAAPDGTLYIADTFNHRILYVNADGDLYNSWGMYGSITSDLNNNPVHPPNGSLNEPWGIAVGPDGKVYVADTWNNRVQVFTAGGQHLDTWQNPIEDAFYGPRDVAVSPDGYVYLTDTGNKRILTFAPDGTLLSSYGEAGMALGQFDEPVGIAVDPETGYVFVADTWNQRIQVLSPMPDGAGFIAIRSWDVSAWYGLSLDNKPQIAVGNGMVFVTDPEAYRVIAFTTEGEFLYYWGDYGFGLDSFGRPSGITIGTDGSIWVTDSEVNRIMRFQPQE